MGDLRDNSFVNQNLQVPFEDDDVIFGQFGAQEFSFKTVGDLRQYIVASFRNPTYLSTNPIAYGKQFIAKGPVRKNQGVVFVVENGVQKVTAIDGRSELISSEDTGAFFSSFEWDPKTIEWDASNVFSTPRPNNTLRVFRFKNKNGLDSYADGTNTNYFSWVRQDSASANNLNSQDVWCYKMSDPTKNFKISRVSSGPSGQAMWIDNPTSDLSMESNITTVVDPFGNGRTTERGNFDTGLNWSNFPNLKTNGNFSNQDISFGSNTAKMIGFFFNGGVGATIYYVGDTLPEGTQVEIEGHLSNIVSRTLDSTDRNARFTESPDYDNSTIKKISFNFSYDFEFVQFTQNTLNVKIYTNDDLHDIPEFSLTKGSEYTDEDSFTSTIINNASQTVFRHYFKDDKMRLRAGSVTYGETPSGSFSGGNLYHCGLPISPKFLIFGKYRSGSSTSYNSQSMGFGESELKSMTFSPVELKAQSADFATKNSYDIEIADNPDRTDSTRGVVRATHNDGVTNYNNSSTYGDPTQLPSYVLAMYVWPSGLVVVSLSGVNEVRQIEYGGNSYALNSWNGSVSYNGLIYRAWGISSSTPQTTFPAVGDTETFVFKNSNGDVIDEQIGTAAITAFLKDKDVYNPSGATENLPTDTGSVSTSLLNTYGDGDSGELKDHDFQAIVINQTHVTVYVRSDEEVDLPMVTHLEVGGVRSAINTATWIDTGTDVDGHSVWSKSFTLESIPTLGTDTTLKFFNDGYFRGNWVGLTLNGSNLTFIYRTRITQVFNDASPDSGGSSQNEGRYFKATSDDEDYYLYSNTSFNPQSTYVNLLNEGMLQIEAVYHPSGRHLSIGELTFTIPDEVPNYGFVDHYSGIGSGSYDFTTSFVFGAKEHYLTTGHLNSNTDYQKGKHNYLAVYDYNSSTGDLIHWQFSSVDPDSFDSTSEEEYQDSSKKWFHSLLNDTGYFTSSASSTNTAVKILRMNDNRFVVVAVGFASRARLFSRRDKAGDEGKQEISGISQVYFKKKEENSDYLGTVNLFIYDKDQSSGTWSYTSGESYLLNRVFKDKASGEEIINANNVGGLFRINENKFGVIINASGRVLQRNEDTGNVLNFSSKNINNSGRDFMMFININDTDNSMTFDYHETDEAFYNFWKPQLPTDLYQSWNIYNVLKTGQSGAINYLMMMIQSNNNNLFPEGAGPKFYTFETELSDLASVGLQKVSLALGNKIGGFTAYQGPYHIVDDEFVYYLWSSGLSNFKLTSGGTDVLRAYNSSTQLNDSNRPFGGNLVNSPNIPNSVVDPTRIVYAARNYPGQNMEWWGNTSYFTGPFYTYVQNNTSITRTGTISEVIQRIGTQPSNAENFSIINTTTPSDYEFVHSSYPHRGDPQSYGIVYSSSKYYHSYGVMHSDKFNNSFNRVLFKDFLSGGGLVVEKTLNNILGFPTTDQEDGENVFVQYIRSGSILNHLEDLGSLPRNWYIRATDGILNASSGEFLGVNLSDSEVEIRTHRFV